MFSCRLNFKNRGPGLLFKTIDLGTETASYCLLLRITRMNMDWNLKK